MGYRGDWESVTGVNKQRSSWFPHVVPYRTSRRAKQTHPLPWSGAANGINGSATGIRAATAEADISTAATAQMSDG